MSYDSDEKFIISSVLIGTAGVCSIAAIYNTFFKKKVAILLIGDSGAGKTTIFNKIMDKDIVADPEATIIGKEGKKSNLIVYDHAGPDKADVEINEEKVKKGDSDEIIYVFVFNVDKFNKEEDKICSQIRHHKMCVESYGKEEKNRKYKLKVIGTHVSSMDDAKDIENTIYKKTTFKNCGFFELKPKEKETFFKKSLQDKILEYIIKD